MSNTPFKAFLIDLIAILSALLDSHRLQAGPMRDGGQIESHLYLGLDSDSLRWERVKFVLLKHEFVTISNHLVKLTPKGVEEATKIEASCKKAGC